MTDDGSLRFAVVLWIDKHDNLLEYEDADVVTENECVHEYLEIEYDIMPSLKKSPTINNLTDGKWRVYIEGEMFFSHEDYYEGGTEYDCYTEINLITAEKVESWE